MQWSTTLNNVYTFTIRPLHGLIKRIIPKSWQDKNATIYQPLLNKNHIQQIYAAATSAHHRINSLHEINTLLVGERSSVFSGSGYEFADNQLYVNGDDSRYINWRMLARTGKLYRKVFIEERRPQVWIVCDKRATMRFGSKTRLKVTQAIIQSLYDLYQLHQQQLSCGGVILDETPYWFTPSQDTYSLQPFIDKLISPAPPIMRENDNQQLDILFNQLAQRLPKGCIIILISDFHDLKKDMLGTLHTLASRHTVIARHVIDPLEENLPQHGKYQVTPHLDAALITLDCDNHNLRQQYENTMQQRLVDIENHIIKAGVAYHRCSADKDIIDEVTV